MAVSPVADNAALASSGDARARLSDNYDTFLLLLTAQLQNQDPLSPMDSTQFTEQLVQYSQVEQQIRTNDQLENLVAHYQAASAGAALAYLGRDAVVDGANTTLDDGEATWSYALDSAAATVTLNVKNASGRTVWSEPGVGRTGSHAFTWDGKDRSGAELPEGTYTLEVVAKDSAGEKVKAAITVRETILGVDFSGASPVVITPTGTRGMETIRAILDD